MSYTLWWISVPEQRRGGDSPVKNMASTLIQRTTMTPPISGRRRNATRSARIKQ
jgi:hypothetical protein